MSGLNGWFVETIRLLFRFSSRLCPARHDLQSRTALFKRRRTDFLDALSVTTPVCGVATPPDQGPELKRRSKFDACFFFASFFLIRPFNIPKRVQSSSTGFRSGPTHHPSVTSAMSPILAPPPPFQPPPFSYLLGLFWTIKWTK